jgi:hypothetical protein
MLKSFKQWWRSASAPGDQAALIAWCEASGFALRGIREQEGFVIETGQPGLEGRIEWGPSQRHYLGEHELRLRGEVGLRPEAHALVMPRGLLEALEHELYHQFTGGVQTRLDEETPEEMRWLAMSPKLGSGLLGDLKAHYAAVSNLTPWLAHWLQGALGELLLAQAAQVPLFALIVQRGRLTLRVAMPVPDVALVQAAQALFAVALEQARLAAQAASED